MLAHPFLFKTQKQASMNVYEYTASKNPKGASQLVQEYNLRPERHPRGLARQLSYCVERDRANALTKLASIHPDNGLFYGIVQEVKTGYEKQLVEQKSELDKMFSNMNGQEIKSEIAQLKSDLPKQTDQSKKTEILMIGAVIIISLALILKK